MAKSTAHGYTYPEGNDLIRSGDDMIAALAQALDPAPVALTVTASAGWTVDAGRVLKIGPMVYWTLAMTRTTAGGAITTDATGNIVTDVPVFTGLPAAYLPGPASATVRCIKSLTHEITGYVDSSGACFLTHGWPAQTFAATSGYVLTALYFLGF